VRIATVLADGFAEPGREGASARPRLRGHRRGAPGFASFGPSSLGVVDLRSHVLLTANAAFDEAELPVAASSSARIPAA